jgi:hypothetical protein
MSSYYGTGPDIDDISEAMRGGRYYAAENSPNPLSPGSNIRDLDEERRGGGFGEALVKGLDFLNKYTEKNFGQSGKYTQAAQDAARRRRESSSSSGSGQIFDNFSIYTPPMPQMGAQTASGGSSGSGLFRDVGGLAGSLGAAAGIFGPLGAPIGMGVGALIDRFA